MYHYKVTNTNTNNVLLDSSRREDFNGYASAETTQRVANGSVADNQLNMDHYVIEVYGAFDNVKKAFNELMGMNGDVYIKEIIDTGSLCPKSYAVICGNILFNGKESIIKHFGLVHYYSLQPKK